tara:strand:- start:220 stop:762 length:543 start_codon:yes stop_codon:yes gene_type:complete
MALFGGARDISMFRGINRELMGDIIVQECAIYKFKLEETNVNIYGEAAEEKYYEAPVLFNVLIDRQDQNYPDSDIGINFERGVTFKFLRDDLVDALVVPQVGDIVWYENVYYEIHDLINNQLFVGKDPDFPNQPNPYGNSDLANFGYDVSIIAETHYIPADKVGISQERLITSIKDVKKR